MPVNITGRQRTATAINGQIPAPTLHWREGDTLTLAVGRLKFTSAKNEARNEEAYVGYKNETVKNVRSFKDLEPLITRIRLEKKVQFLSDDLLKQGPNGVRNAAPPVGQEAQKTQSNSTDPVKKK